MTIDSIDIEATIAEVESLLQVEKNLSPAMTASVKMLLFVVTLLVNRLGLNSRNSSKPPASDPNREKKQKKSKSNKSAGGQKGHKGCTLEATDNPDEIQTLSIDKRRLPRGQYHLVGFEPRQVIHIRISQHVIEYRAEILENEQGQQFIASFPVGVTRPVQYGSSVKANAVYMSQFQLIPFERVQDHFDELFGISLSAGSLYNFNQEAYKRLELFEVIAKQQLIKSPVMHSDETGININGKRVWLHGASNATWSLFFPHLKRGQDAMDAMGILPHYSGTLIHDHWKPYYRYGCTHALCNAHHLRELTWSAEQAHQKWAGHMKKLLVALNDTVDMVDGELSLKDARKWRMKYRNILKAADKECPPPDPPKNKSSRGRIKRSKSRNLLERLRDYEDDVLRFIENKDVPFTNNQGERDIRMTKVQQKISGCFRSMEGALIFCRIRSYLSTCRKQGVSIGEALECLFNNRWPEFIQAVTEKRAE